MSYQDQFDGYEDGDECACAHAYDEHVAGGACDVEDCDCAYFEPVEGLEMDDEA